MIKNATFTGVWDRDFDLSMDLQKGVETMSNLTHLFKVGQKAIESYCYRVNKVMEDGEHIEPFDTLKTQYYVKELLDSEIDDREDAEIIGWTESYDLCNYYDNLIATIEEDCKEWERLNNNGKMIEEHLYLNKCNNSEESGMYQLILNGMELWYGTLAEINAVVKSMIYRLTKDFTVQSIT